VHAVDVRDAAHWPGLLDGVDVVCHQAALVGAGTDPADLPAYAALNDLGTAALLAAMHVAGVSRLVLASSMVVYGEGRYACAEHGDQPAMARDRAALEAGEFEVSCPVCGASLEWRPVGEDARLDPRSSYAASKVAQEHYSSTWARQAGGSAIALRYHNVYGPGMPRDTPYSGVAAMFGSAIASGRPPQVFEDGRQMRDFVHVSDVATANVIALEAVCARPPGSWSAYNVCSGQPVSIGEVAAYVAQGSSLLPEVTGGYRLGDVRHVVASPDLAAAELGFRAQVSPADGLVAFAGEPMRGGASPAGRQ
jgi:dTDP-L-rhamnose 4-epimerase